eukprot:CAMPEP_0170467086 /NCGR_PEP_ID=MMETSP0123-20130129/10797_1 /TAXON_ID=182087 /ORGANISM="Favella ehrenbergii, Strain Fehren 1" /LENGTH=217 /DNA_ID=CAMNT_0010733365 /DNA_START=29 /DNA_END=682 /DNA_ORIENTATION=-
MLDNKSSDSDKLLNKTRDPSKSADENHSQLRNSEDLEEEFFGKKKGSQTSQDQEEIAAHEDIMAASTPPMSPGKRILRVVGSPGRYVKTQMREGSAPASIFALVIICLGAGTLTIPYNFYQNGYIVGCVCILSGAILSSFTGYLMAYCAEKTNGSCYEEIALATYGPGWQKFTSICMIPTNLGFVITYVVLFKSFAPHSLITAGIHLPSWCDESRTG